MRWGVRTPACQSLGRFSTEAWLTKECARVRIPFAISPHTATHIGPHGVRPQRWTLARVRNGDLGDHRPLKRVVHKGRASPTGFGYGFCFLGLTIQ
jgi:hypothetical protein